MQFKHPEILYFLFLLILPILVHLFQLRRFKKQSFTNVRILKDLSIQTRKSSQIKKWLLLATRLLLLAAAVIAFAQPFFPATDAKASGNDLYIILDNSLSMEAKGQSGQLMRRAIEDLLEHTPADQTFSLLTADRTFWNTDIKTIRQDLQNLDYSAVPFVPEALMAKIRSQKPGTGKDVLLITDAAGIQKTVSNDDLNAFVYLAKAETKANASVDSVYLKQTLDNFYEIGARVSARGNVGELSVSLYDKGKLIAKTQADPAKSNEVKFTIPKQDFDGWLSVSDNGLQFDNTYYFNIAQPKTTSVLIIGDPAASQFLGRIYTAPEFEFEAVPLRGLDYNSIEKRDLVILNEPTEIPQALQTTLKAFVEKGGNLAIIPSVEGNVAQLNGLSGIFRAQFEPATGTRQVTRIAFNHPLYWNVFEKSVENFQYPEIKRSFKLNTSSPAALAFDDGSPFLASVQNQGGTVYLFAAPLNKNDGNFQNSPLIVPTFYNMSQNATSGVTAYTIGQGLPVMVDAQLQGDQVVSVAGNDISFIPEQRQMGSRVQLSFGDLPAKAGNYQLLNKTQPVKNISFNYSRSESNADVNAAAYADFESVGSVSQLFNDWHSSRTDTGIWRWFVILALIALVAEVLIQKFVK